MARKTKASSDSPFSASGPNLERRASASLSAAISLAQNYACRKEADEGTWYVRENDDVLYHVERIEGGVVLTYPAP